LSYWIVSSKHSRDQDTSAWDSKWTTDGFIRHAQFFPSKREGDFAVDDRCILKVFGQLDFVADFRLKSESRVDDGGDVFYEIDDLTEWDFPLHQHSLPSNYTEQLTRSPSTEISETDYWELIGIRNYTQNLRLNYKNVLRLKVSEREVESLIDSKNALSELGLNILERQYELSPGNIIDLLCQDRRGDLVVVELKLGSANQTIGQLARYVTDVREKRAKSTQKVRGLVLTLDVDEQLVKAARGVDFEVMLCQLTI